MTADATGGIGARSNLTTSQLLIWTGQRLQPGEPLYNMILVFRVAGPVDPVLFDRAFQALVDRSDALRAAIDVDDGVPRQRFDACPRYRTPLVDLSGEADPEAALADWLAANRQRDFDLSRELYHSVLVKLADDDFAWYLNQHHVMTDAWAVGVLYERLQSFYALARNGGLDTAPALPDYAAFVDYEREARHSSRLSKLADYWREKLSRPFLPSVFYHPPPGERTGRTDRVPLDLGTDRSARLRALAGEPDFRAFSADLAHFQLFATVLMSLLHRLGGHRRLAFGTPSHNRATAEHKATPGLFIELYPVQAELGDGESFRTLNRRIASDMHQLLLHAAPGASGFSHQRAFDVVLNFITAKFGNFAGMPMRSEWVHAGYGDHNHLLRLQVQDFDQRKTFGLYFDVNADTFDERERGWLTTHFLRLLDALLDDPDQPIDAVPLTGDDERRRLLVDLNGPAPAETAETVVDAFSAAAGTHGNTVALREDGRTLDYAALDAACTQLATALAARGIGRGDRVALLLPRSTDAVVSIFGVLRSGAAFVPLDAAHPADRIAQILNDAEPALVITQPALENKVPESVDATTLEALVGAARPNTVADPATPGPGDVAYVIYTSGSTGQPKGVVVRHASLANYIAWARSQYDGGAVYPLYSSLAFDLTVTSLFTPLTGGGELVIYPEDPDGREIAIRRVVEDNRAEVVKLTPVHLALIRHMDLAGSRIRRLVVGGEDFKTDLAAAIDRRFDGRVEIYNEYGPTEGTVACMIHRYDPRRDTGASVPIGRAIDNLEIYVLDGRGEPVPQGVTGELSIGGAGVADGYLGLADATAECFVANPFRAGGRMYRTGDLARWTRDGVAEYLGRIDHQVKIRGVRIETAEVEAALLAHPAVRDCVVDAVESAQADGDDEAFCTRCGISARHPDAHLDRQGICRICHDYEKEPDKAAAYFGTMDQLEAIVAETRAAATGDGPDSMMLLSGGKDSTYALCRLVDLGLRPLVFTLDNGFISQDAKTNIRRVCDRLGLELVTGSTPAMNAIFADSLARHSNVCQGCFKTIYTLSMSLANERGIRTIFTGLSRGQIFETRIADLHRQRIVEPDAIDRTIVEARKAYHRMDDAVSRCLDVSLFDDDAVFERIRFVDFYRYCDVKLDEVYAYLGTQAPWIRPRDTGRSTNCLINEAGIYVHKTERGFHNYSLPYSWDVRLGHKQRDAAREELDDRIDVENVRRILAEVGYRIEKPFIDPATDRRLVAWYVADAPTDAADLKSAVAARLPAEYVPSAFVAMDTLPVTANGKVDRDALPAPDEDRPELAMPYAAPVGSVEQALAEVWADQLGVDRVGRDDNFFDLGGDSIINIQIVAGARRLGLKLTPAQIFDHPTVAGLATVAAEIGVVETSSGPVTGEVRMTGIQRRFFARRPRDPNRFSQVVAVEIPAGWDEAIVGEAWRRLANRHDVLRARYARQGDRWQQVFAEPLDTRSDVIALDAAAPGTEPSADIDRVARRLNDGLDIGAGRLFALARRVVDAERALLVVAIHHLAVDGVSWWILLGEFEQLCERLVAGGEPTLPPRGSSLRDWADACDRLREQAIAAGEPDAWRAVTAAPLPIPTDGSGTNLRVDARDVVTSLDAVATRRLLADAPAAFGVQVPDLLLTALAETLTDWTGADRCRVAVEGHGREPIDDRVDVLGTVGWFTSLYPVTLGVPVGSPGDALKSVKETLRRVPSRGVAYNLLRFPDSGASLVGDDEPAVLFNYLGQWDRTLSTRSRLQLAGPIRAAFDGEGERAHLIEVNAIVFDGRLEITWTYAPTVHGRATVRQLGDTYIARLLALADYCVDSGESGHTPSDFPAADLDQDDLDALLADFGE